METIKVKILPLQDAPKTYAPYIKPGATHVIKYSRYWLDCGTEQELNQLIKTKKYWTL